MLKENSLIFRETVLKMISDRKILMQDPRYQSQDFLTLLLSDSLFNENESLMIDECTSFYSAAT